MKTTEKLLCKQANQLDLVDYLLGLGHRPQKIRGNDYWYLSPLHQEKTASFKVNRKMNVWYDHAMGKGGTLVDFGLLYHHCSVKELLNKLGDKNGSIFSFHPHRYQTAGEKKESPDNSRKIQIIGSREIADPGLLEYLDQRKIQTAIAREFCQEVCFELYGKKQLAIGFKNENGGYELRNPDFKGSSSPKEPRLISQPGAKKLAVFEGFFSFLSFQMLQRSSQKNDPDLSIIQADYLVLNSLSFFEKSRERMEQYQQVHLFLDRDKMGILSAQKALQWSEKYKDKSHSYDGFKDLNNYLIKSMNPEIKESQRRGMRL